MQGAAACSSLTATDTRANASSAYTAASRCFRHCAGEWLGKVPSESLPEAVLFQELGSLHESEELEKELYTYVDLIVQLP